MKIKLISVMIAALAAPALAESTSDPSQQARVHVQDNSVYTLSNHLLTWSSSAKAPAVFTLQQKGRAAAQSSQSPFSITTTEGIYPAASFTISDIKIDRLYPAEVSIAPSHQHHGQSITATFKNEQAGITIKWSAELRDGENYVTQVYAIYAARPIEITHIDLLKLAGTGFELEDKAQGATLIHRSKRLFFHIKNVPSVAKITPEGTVLDFDCQLTMRKGQCYSFSTVQGISSQLSKKF